MTRALRSRCDENNHKVPEKVRHTKPPLAVAGLKQVAPEDFASAVFRS